MTNRERLLRFLINAAMVAAAVLGARYGIPIPPPEVTLPPVVVPPPVITLPEKPSPTPNAHAAIGQIQFGNAGCSATIIGERRGDGRYAVLTAAHCVKGKPQTGTMRLRDGRSIGIRVAAVDHRADCCWCWTDATTEVFPFAVLADRTPPPGTKIWHAGYGVDVPANTEHGTLDEGPNADGQVRMTLSVSSGDSGGGICSAADGTVISCVCCTTDRGRRASVWGASPEAIRRLMPGVLTADQWTPLEVPLKAKD